MSTLWLCNIHVFSPAVGNYRSYISASLQNAAPGWLFLSSCPPPTPPPPNVQDVLFDTLGSEQSMILIARNPRVALGIASLKNPGFQVLLDEVGWMRRSTG